MAERMSRAVAQLDQDRAELRSFVNRARERYVTYLRAHLDDAVEGDLPDEVALRVIDAQPADIPPRIFALAVAELMVRGYGIPSFADMTDELLRIEGTTDADR